MQAFCLKKLLNANLHVFWCQNKFMYFERLPIGYIESPLFQYDYKDFAFTNWDLNQDYVLPESYPLYKLSNNEIIQLF
jgi:CRISPR-associated protein Cas5h